MKIKIYELVKESYAVYETEKEPYIQNKVKRIPKYEVEIEDSEVIPFVRNILSKGVPQKE